MHPIFLDPFLMQRLVFYYFRLQLRRNITQSTTAGVIRPIDENSTCEDPPTNEECQQVDPSQRESNFLIWCLYDNSSHESSLHNYSACAHICKRVDEKCYDLCPGEYFTSSDQCISN